MPNDAGQWPDWLRAPRQQAPELAGGGASGQPQHQDGGRRGAVPEQAAGREGVPGIAGQVPVGVPGGIGGARDVHVHPPAGAERAHKKADLVNFTVNNTPAGS